MLRSYAGNPIPAWNLEPCLTEGFESAADILAGDTPTSFTPLVDNSFECEQNGVEIVILQTTYQSDALDYHDLASILAMISKFHQQYAMPNVDFEIHAQKGDHLGHGWVEVSTANRMKSTNGTANATATA